MVIYDLQCAVGHRFEGWFQSAESFEEQKRASLIACSICGAAKIEKLPSGAHVGGGLPLKPTDKVISSSQNSSTDKITNIDPIILMKAVHQYLEKNYKNVGDQFTDQAIRMHREEVPTEPIYGSASQEQKEKLEEEGVPYSLIPKIPEEFEN